MFKILIGKRPRRRKTKTSGMDTSIVQEIDCGSIMSTEPS